MSKFTQTEKYSELSEAMELRMKYHPLRIFIYLILVGGSSAFLFLSISYLLTSLGTDFNHFKLPLIFHANTVLIIASSYTMTQTRKAITRDDWKGYTNGLLVTAGIGLGFTFFQLKGWEELIAQGIFMNNNIAGAYLYIISGLHLLHLVLGIVFLIVFAIKALMIKNDPVQSLIFESDPFSKMKVSLLCTYWYFVDGLWVYLYLFFLLNIHLLAKGVQ